eukprot:6214677-Pleurochrysis_carterae.AAC.3
MRWPRVRSSVSVPSTNGVLLQSLTTRAMHYSQMRGYRPLAFSHAFLTCPPRCPLARLQKTD